MRPIETKFKTYSQDINAHDYFNKMVDERAYFEVYPNAVDYEMLEPNRKQIASYAKANLIGPDGTLMRLFEKSARKVSTTARTVSWRLYTQEGDIRSSFLRHYEANNPQPGKGGVSFYIGLDTPWFGPNDVIIFQNLREIPLLVRSEPEPDGHVWRYEVKLLVDDYKAFFPLNLLKSGDRLIQIGSLIGEATVERGNIHFGEGDSYIEFEVPMTRMGWQMKVTDEAWYAATHFRLRPMDKEGAVQEGTPGILYNTLDMKFERAVNRQIDMWLTYGRSTSRFAGKFLDGLTQKELTSGPGLYEFMESSYIYDYSVDGGSIDIFREFLPPLWNDHIDPDMREVEIFTGTGGLMLWDRWCREADIQGIVHSEEWNYEKETPRFKGRTGVGLDAKDYISFHIKPFGKVTIKYLPFLDSELIESRKYKNLPITSYEFIIFNFGYGDQRDSNVYILENSNFNQYGYTAGTWTPKGPRLNNPGASGFAASANPHENAYYYIYESMVGLVVKDPGYLIWYRPSFA